MLTRSEFEQAISPARAARYLSSVAGDSSAALKLYEHNNQISASAWVVIADVEVVLRNIVADAIHAHHATVRPGALRWYDGPSWFTRGQWFTKDTLKSIEVARRRVRDPGPSGGQRPSEGRLIAELSLGFWRYLLIGRYEHDLWNPAIRAKFDGMSHLSGSDSRHEAHRRVEKLNYLRNRIAHHEPIYEPFSIPGQGTIDVERVLSDAIELIGWSQPATAEWISRRR